jgi:hypothetical protein
MDGGIDLADYLAITDLLADELDGWMMDDGLRMDGRMVLMDGLMDLDNGS